MSSRKWDKTETHFIDISYVLKPEIDFEQQIHDENFLNKNRTEREKQKLPAANFGTDFSQCTASS